MSKFAVTRGLYNIIQFVNEKHFPSKEEIIDKLDEKDLKVSERTLERYLESIRADLGLEIKYSRANKGYFIDVENSVRIESFFRFLELVEVADIFSKSLKDSAEIFEYVSFDDSKSFKGIENLKAILLAIKENKQLTFQHHNFGRDSQREYTVTPLLLKEYLNRWYVIGAFGKEEIRTFGIDRITDLEIGKTSKLKREDFKKNLEKFNHTVGLTYGEGEPEKVVLLVNALHVKYMRSLPLHSSQVIFPKDKNNQHKVEFLVYPNYEFKTQILKIGAEVEVLEPEYLRKEIKQTLKASLSRYSNPKRGKSKISC